MDHCAVRQWPERATTVRQGGQKVGEKNSEFSRFFQSHKLTFPYVIATKSKCNNDLHQGSFHINSSNITGHHRTLTKYLNDKLKIPCLLQFFTAVAQNSLRIPWVFHVQRNPWVFQVCDHPVRWRKTDKTVSSNVCVRWTSHRVRWKILWCLQLPTFCNEDGQKASFLPLDHGGLNLFSVQTHNEMPMMTLHTPHLHIMLLQHIPTQAICTSRN